MTLPTLIQNYKKQAVLNQVKKAYSEINQALKMAEVDHGDPAGWTYGTAFDGPSAEYYLNTYILPYMKVVKNCGTGTGCLNGDVYSIGGIKHYAYGDSCTNTAKAIVSSGYTIGITSGGSYANIQITLNNKKSDRIVMGRDQFQYSSFRKRTLLGERESVLSEESIYGCHKAKTNTSGMGCLSLIILDGWEIRDDYPVKF